MTNGRFVKQCEGFSKAFLTLVEQAKHCKPRSKLVYDKEAASIFADELRDFADVIEKAAG
jgi:hypothetical protein